MAEISTVARPYAEALYGVAAKGDINAWADTLNAMAALAAQPAMVDAINHPKLTDDEVFGVFTGVLNRSLSSEAQNLVHTLIANDRLALLPEIATQFHDLKNEREGSADAAITSAFPMSDDEVKRLVADLEKRFRVRLRPTVTIDKTLIGGVRVVVGDEVLDSSIHARLEQMRATLCA